MGDLSHNFSRSEFECKCSYPECIHTPVDIELVMVIQDAIDHFEHLESQRAPDLERIAAHINSGYRCAKHNDDVTDGEGSGVHTFGIAADIWLEYVYPLGPRARIPQTDLADYFEAKYPDKYGIGRYPRMTQSQERTHIDVRKQKARWTA